MTVAIFMFVYVCVGFFGTGIAYKIFPKSMLGGKCDGDILFWGTVIWPVLLFGLIFVIVCSLMESSFRGYIDWANRPIGQRKSKKDIVA